jgi:hypothetical protein
MRAGEEYLDRAKNGSQERGEMDDFFPLQVYSSLDPWSE